VTIEHSPELVLIELRSTGLHMAGCGANQLWENHCQNWCDGRRHLDVILIASGGVGNCCTNTVACYTNSERPAL
jgi:hypothetical protein